MRLRLSASNLEHADIVVDRDSCEVIAADIEQDWGPLDVVECQGLLHRACT